MSDEKPSDNVEPFPGTAPAAETAPPLDVTQTALLAWAGLSLYFHEVQNGLRDVVLRAEVHAPTKGRHNERVLVFSDRLTSLAHLMQLEPKTHLEATTWWKEREDRLMQLCELPRVIAMVEREFGAPPAAAKYNDVEKIIGMIEGLLGLTAQQKQVIEQQGIQIKNLLARRR